MKLYIAGPMTGLPDFNYPAFRKAAEELTAAGYDVLNPIDVDITGTTEDERTWDWFMRRTLAMVLKADAIATLDGWRNSRGATIEVDLADRLSIDEAPVRDWIAYPPVTCGHRCPCTSDDECDHDCDCDCEASA